MTIRQWQKKIHAWARSKGWWDASTAKNDPLDIRVREHRAVAAEKLLLIHSEITEAVEEYRNGKPLQEVYFESGGMSLKPPKPCGFPTELADAAIRIFDLAAACDIDLEHEIERKMKYNETRAHKHGGKLF